MTAGRAVDIAQNTISSAAYKAITSAMKEVPEGRKDIYHFESDATVPKVTSDVKAKWPKP